MPRANSCRKGKSAERAAAKLLRSLGYASRRGQQHRGGADSPDVIGVPGVHVEVKSDRKIRVGTEALRDAWVQSHKESSEGERPVVLWMEFKRGWRLTWLCYTTGVLVTTSESGIGDALANIRSHAG